MEDQANHPTEDMPMNMAMLYYMQVQKIMIGLTEALIQDQLHISKEWLEELYTKVSFKLKDDEKKEIDSLFKLLSNKFFLMEQSSNNRTYHNSTKELLRIINRVLLKHMAKYRMIFPEGKLAGMDRVVKRYGLE